MSSSVRLSSPAFACFDRRSAALSSRSARATRWPSAIAPHSVSSSKALVSGSTAWRPAPASDAPASSGAVGWAHKCRARRPPRGAPRVPETASTPRDGASSPTPNAAANVTPRPLLPGTAQPVKVAPRSDCGGLAGSVKDHAPTDRHGVIGEPLVEPAEQGHVDGDGDAVFPFGVHQHPE